MPYDPGHATYDVDYDLWRDAIDDLSEEDRCSLLAAVLKTRLKTIPIVYEGYKENCVENIKRSVVLDYLRGKL